MTTAPANSPLLSVPSGLVDHASPFDPPKSTDSFISLYRHDSPQLTLHDFHKFQDSPVLLSTPESDIKRVRRKQSVADLAASPDFKQFRDHWSPSAILPRTFHSQSHQAFTVPSLPSLPIHPRPRPYTASPSLSSTVDTLQSSPTQTPIHHRGLGIDKQETCHRRQISEPLRTKRTFGSVKRAKRLPRQPGSSIGGRSGGQGEIWEVYAAVFDPPEEAFWEVKGDLAETPSKEDVPESSAGAESVINDSPGDSDEANASNTVDLRHFKNRCSNRQPSSSLSLSKFNFPHPPSHEDWNGAFGHLAEPTPPSSPATILLHGASFDLLNPHASLVLGTRDIETPAEIDGLLDDYFESERKTMQYDTLTGEPSPTSLRTPSESSRRVLYDDPDSARRNILHAQGSHLPSSRARRILSGPRSPPAQQSRTQLPRPSKGDETRASDPFDLTLSESDSHNRFVNPRYAPRQAYIAEVSPDSPSIPQGLGISDHVEGGDANANLLHSTEPTIREILDGYDYRRSDPLLVDEVNIADSPMVEHGRTVDTELTYSTSHGLITPLHTPECLRTQDVKVFQPVTGGTYISTSLPTPPVPVYNPLRFCAEHSEVPTSEQTYGETNRLLLITPEIVRRPSQSPRTHCDLRSSHSPLQDHANKAHDEVPESHWPDGGGLDLLPRLNRDVVSESLGTPMLRLFGGKDEEDGDLARRLQRSSSFYPEDAEEDWETQYSASHNNLPRPLRTVSVGSYANTSFCGDQSLYGEGHLARNDCPLSPIPDRSPPASRPASPVSEADGQDNGPNSDSDEECVEERRETRKTIKQLEAKILEDEIEIKYGTWRPVDMTKHKANKEDLARLRRLYPSAARELALKASESISSLKLHGRHKLQKSTAFRPNYNPRNSFTRAVQLGPHQTEPGPPSDQRGLLATPTTPTTPTPYGNIHFNDSTGTFVTIRGDSPTLSRSGVPQIWSPFDRDPTARAIFPNSNKSNTPPLSKDIELKTLSKRLPRAAMSSQQEPRELHLLRKQPIQRLTDAQLLARSPGWSTYPNFHHTSPLARTANYSFSPKEPMLVKPPGSPYTRAIRAEQKRISKRYLYSCAVLPPLALMFWAGAFDKAIEKQTQGRVKAGAGTKEKRKALAVFFPLGCIVWGILVVAIWLMVVLLKGGRSGGIANGAAF